MESSCARAIADCNCDNVKKALAIKGSTHFWESIKQIWLGVKLSLSCVTSTKTTKVLRFTLKVCLKVIGSLMRELLSNIFLNLLWIFWKLIVAYGTLIPLSMELRLENSLERTKGQLSRTNQHWKSSESVGAWILSSYIMNVFRKRLHCYYKKRNFNMGINYLPYQHCKPCIICQSSKCLKTWCRIKACFSVFIV